jgi:hypothetical protein
VDEKYIGEKHKMTNYYPRVEMKNNNTPGSAWHFGLLEPYRKTTFLVLFDAKFLGQEVCCHLIS